MRNTVTVINARATITTLRNKLYATSKLTAVEKQLLAKCNATVIAAQK